MLFCPRPAHWDPSRPGGNSLLDWNDAIYRPHRRHFIIQRTLTPWMSNTEHAGTEMEGLSSPSQLEADDERPRSRKVSIKTKSSPNTRQGLRNLRSEGTEHRLGLKCVVDWNTESDGIVVESRRSPKYTAAINLESFCLSLPTNRMVIIVDKSRSIKFWAQKHLICQE